MVRVYYKKDEVGDLIFITVTKTLDIVLVSRSDYNLKSAKRKRSIRSKFLRPYSVSVDSLIDVYLIGLHSFTITEKDFVRWLGRISLDHVQNLSDVDWIIRVKKDYNC